MNEYMLSNEEALGGLCAYLGEYGIRGVNMNEPGNDAESVVGRWLEGVVADAKAEYEEIAIMYEICVAEHVANNKRAYDANGRTERAEAKLAAVGAALSKAELSKAKLLDENIRAEKLLREYLPEMKKMEARAERAEAKLVKAIDLAQQANDDCRAWKSLLDEANTMGEGR